MNLNFETPEFNSNWDLTTVDKQLLDAYNNNNIEQFKAALHAGGDLNQDFYRIIYDLVLGGPKPEIIKAIIDYDSFYNMEWWLRTAVRIDSPKLIGILHGYGYIYESSRIEGKSLVAYALENNAQEVVKELFSRGL